MSLWVQLHRPAVQHGVRAAVAAALAWQVAVPLPPMLSDQAYYAPLGVVIAVHPTVAGSAGAARRSGLSILTGLGPAVGLYEVTRRCRTRSSSPRRSPSDSCGASGWVSFAAVLRITVAPDDPGAYVLRYGGLTLLGAAIGVLVTTAFLPPMQLTRAVEEATARSQLAVHLEEIAGTLRAGRRVEAGAGWVLADALAGPAGVVRTPYDSTDGTTPDRRDRRIAGAEAAPDRPVAMLRNAQVADEDGFFALGEVAVGVRRGPAALGAHRRQPQAA